MAAPESPASARGERDAPPPSEAGEWRETPSDEEYGRLVWLGSFGILPRGSLNRPVCRVAEQKRRRADYLRWCFMRVEEGQPSEGSAEWMSLAQACLPRGPAPAPRSPAPALAPDQAISPDQRRGVQRPAPAPRSPAPEPDQASSSFYADSLQTLSQENSQ